MRSILVALFSMFLTGLCLVIGQTWSFGARTLPESLDDLFAAEGLMLYGVLPMAAVVGAVTAGLAERKAPSVVAATSSLPAVVAAAMLLRFDPAVMLLHVAGLAGLSSAIGGALGRFSRARGGRKVRAS